MNTYEKVLNIFCCPICHNELQVISSENRWEKEEEDFYCPHCEKRFLCIDEVPIFVDSNSIGWVGLDKAYGQWQSTDQSVPFDKFYEIVEKFSNNYCYVEDLVRLAKGWRCKENEAYNQHVQKAPYLQEINRMICDPVYDWICKETQPLLLGNSVILDVGIGGGDVERIMTTLLEDDGTVVGIDISLDCAYSTKNFLEKDCNKGKVILCCADFTQLPLKKDSIDIIISSGGLGHIERLDLALQNISLALKPNGYIITAEPKTSNVSSKCQHLISLVDRSKGHEDIKERLLNKGFTLLKEENNIGKHDSYIQTGAIYKKQPKEKYL